MSDGSAPELLDFARALARAMAREEIARRRHNENHDEPNRDLRPFLERPTVRKLG